MASKPAADGGGGLPADSTTSSNAWIVLLDNRRMLEAVCYNEALCGLYGEQSADGAGGPQPEREAGVRRRFGGIGGSRSARGSVTGDEGAENATASTSAAAA